MSASISDQAYTRRRLAWSDSRRSMKFIVRRPLKEPSLRRAATFRRIVGKLRGEEDFLDQEGAATTSDAVKGSAKDSRGAKEGTAAGKVAVDKFVVVTNAPHPIAPHMYFFSKTTPIIVTCSVAVFHDVSMKLNRG